MFRIVLSDCIDDGNNIGYSVDCEGDFNKYETDDLKDLTKSGLGTAGREVAVNTEFLVFLIIFITILGLVGFMWARGKGFLGGSKT